jgi:hypothetical protein
MPPRPARRSALGARDVSDKTQETLNKEFELTQPYCPRCDNFEIACVCIALAEKAATEKERET